jgi:hypothetical protein
MQIVFSRGVTLILILDLSPHLGYRHYEWSLQFNNNLLILRIS